MNNSTSAAGITRATIARKIREIRADQRRINQDTLRYGFGRTMTIGEINSYARTHAWQNAIPAYAWPGGYDVAYYPEGEYDLIGDVLCAECARAYVKDNQDAKLFAQCEDGYEGNDSADHLTCDDCYRIITRAWCRPAGHRHDRDLPRAEWARLHLEAEHGEGDTWTIFSRAPHRRSFMRQPNYRRRLNTLAVYLRPVRNLHAARPELTRYGGRKVAA